MSQEAFDAQMQRLLHPSFVVMAAPSTDPRSMVRYQTTRNLAESQKRTGGELAFISLTNGDSIEVTLPDGETRTYKCYKDLAALVAASGKKPDVVVAPLPPKPTIEIADACSVFEVPIVMIGSGFGEVVSPDAVEDTRRLTEIFARGRIIGIGPNTYGAHVSGPTSSWNLTFDFVGGLDEAGLPATGGRISVITQSGGVCAGICTNLTNLGLPIDFALAIGNSTGIDLNQLAVSVAARDQTEVAFYYLERSPGQAFVDSVAATTPSKPVVVFKGARHDGNQAAKTHTDSVSSDNDVLECALKKAGAIVVTDEAVIPLLLGMLEHGMAVRLAEKIHAARSKGRAEPGVLIITQSGADGVISTDLALDRKIAFRLAEPEQSSIAQVQEAAGNILTIRSNPVDLGPTGSACNVCHQLASDPDVGVVMLAIRRPFHESLIPNQQDTNPDVVLTFPTNPSQTAFRHAVEKGWLTSPDTQTTLDAFALLYQYARFLADQKQANATPETK
jgi:succinyl-CoA synthetase alpha subunit